MIEITTSENKKYIIHDHEYEKIKELVDGLDPFDLDVILQAIAQGKILSTPEKAYWQ